MRRHSLCKLQLIKSVKKALKELVIGSPSVSYMFPRLAAGFSAAESGHRPSSWSDAGGDVLQRFSKAEADDVDVAVKCSVLIVKDILAAGMERALSAQ